MDILTIIISFIVLIYSAILHEIAHGFVADRFGDPTARLAGRLTLNPKSHIDPVMTILVPLSMFLFGFPIIFGAAKPVPVDPFNLRDYRKDSALISLAGPGTNIVLAILASLLFHMFAFVSPIENFFVFLVNSLLVTIVNINLMLAIFNLLPIPPLDGSKIFALLLPEKEANAYLSLGTIGIFLILILFNFPIGNFSLGEFLGNLFLIARGLLI